MWLRIVICAALFLGGMASGIKIHAGLTAQRDLKAIGEVERDKLRRMGRGDAAAVKHERYKAAVEVRERIVRVEVDRVVEKAVYRNVCLDDDGLRILAADIAAREAPGKPAGAVSRPASSDADR